ncbi:MAG: 2-C-methyl-D-erythritol 2,4-cyclodiphosphate synthase [Burkholderiaceae bacterium]|nr:2-C-methyl-D-erythritol 2,4-cyclodiphosphate synthase [Burkholderiaceae bacterium]
MPHPSDLPKAQAQGQEPAIRIGQGFDVHALVKGRPLVLGGVSIEHETGLLGHSDADVLLHAIADALLGALGLGDIGRHFPDTDDAFKNIDSRVLLRRVVKVIQEQGFRVAQIDATLIAQRPKLMPYIDTMVANIGQDCQCDFVNVKATTTERLGFTGREEGIAAQAIASLVRA